MRQWLLSAILISALLAPTDLVQRAAPAPAAYLQVAPQADPTRPRYTITDLGTLGGAMSQGMGINKHGHVVGASQSGALAYAFNWDGGTMTNLGDLGAKGSWAHDINDNGLVVGGSALSSGDNHAARWTAAGIQDLGTLGGSVSYAFALNNAGQVMGYARCTRLIVPILGKRRPRLPQ